MTMRNTLKQAGLITMGLVSGILISLNFSANAQKEDAPTVLPFQELRSFADVYNAIKQGYVENIDDKKLITYAISGMLANLDPHSAYLDAESFKDLQVNTAGEFGGLGIEVGMEDGFVKVVSPIEDTPAFRAGIKAGDLIIKLDDTPVKGMTLNDAVKRMRGKPKTAIVLTIARKNESKPIIVTLKREVIKVQSVKSKLIEPGYGYLRVTQFQEETTADTVKHLNKLFNPTSEDKAAGKIARDAKDSRDSKEDAKPTTEAPHQPLRGLILDLRNDPGGLLNSAVGVSAAFLPPGTLVVSTDGRTEDARRKYTAIPENYTRGLKNDILQQLPAGARSIPLIVLVNGGSASASEIVAGALQDHKRAVVLGTQTFGKGSVQTVLPLSNNTAIKLTTARYYTPAGRAIQAKGITPDVIVEESLNGGNHNVLREADLNRHLENDKERAARESAPKQGDKDKNADEAAPPPFEFASKNDYQLNQALNLLKAWQIIKQQ